MTTPIELLEAADAIWHNQQMSNLSVAAKLFDLIRQYAAQHEAIVYHCPDATIPIHERDHTQSPD